MKVVTFFASSFNFAEQTNKDINPESVVFIRCKSFLLLKDPFEETK